jgi:hypothetical protein
LASGLRKARIGEESGGAGYEKAKAETIGDESFR